MMKLIYASLSTFTLILMYLDYGEAASPFVPMMFTSIPQDTAVVPGERAIMSCTALYDGEEPDNYSWERDSKLLSMGRTGNNKLILNNGSIIFVSVEEGGLSPDIGTYRCIAEKVDDQTRELHLIASPEARLMVARVGEFTVEPVDISGDAAITIGDDAMFECRSDGFPAPLYSWTKNGQRIEPNNRVLVHGDGEVLEILSITEDDMAVYQCTATNKAGSITSREATLSAKELSGPLFEGPSFMVRPRDASVELGHSVTLYCAVRGRGDDGSKPRVSWLRQGSTIDIDSEDGQYTRLGAGSLVISNVSTEDEGRYTCRAANSVDTDDSEVLITVLIAPYFVTRPTNTYGRVNGEAELQCDIRGYPQPRIYWLRNSDYCRLDEYIKMEGGNLKIMGLMTSDASYYQCIGENSVGTVYGTAQLLVLEEGEQVELGLLPSDSSSNSTILPGVPSNLRTMLVSDSYVSLKWDSSIGAAGYTVSVVPASDPNSRLRSANTSSTDYTVQGLQPSTEYVFKVSAFNNNGRSVQTDLRRSTHAEAAVPTPVRNVQTALVTHNSIDVSYTTPIETNGEIREYRIYYYSTDQSEELSVVSSSNSASITSLSPHTEYHIRVVAFNLNGQGMPSSELDVLTRSAKPSAAPLNVVAEGTGTNSIVIRWDPPPPDTTNGQLTGYKIRYKVKGSSSRAKSHTTDADARNYEISNLESGTDYVVRVGAVNSNGTGELSPWLDATTFTAELDESRPPGRPLRLQVEPFPRELIVRWIPANDSILVRRYDLGYGTVAPDEIWKQIDPKERFTFLENLEPKTNYVMQLLASNRAGEGQPIYQQTFTSEEANLPSLDSRPELMPPVEITTVVLSSTAILVRWHDNTLGNRQKNSDGRIYTVKCIPVGGSLQRRPEYLNTTGLIATVEGLRPYTEYDFSVMLTRDDKTSRYSFSVRERTLEDAPGTPPVGLTISKIENDPSHLIISWEPPTQPNGRITDYQISYSFDKTIPFNQWEQDGVSGHTMNHRFGPVRPFTIYHFSIIAETKEGPSPPSTPVTIRTPDASGLGGAGLDGEEFTGHNIRHPNGRTTPRKEFTGSGGIISETVPTETNLMEKYPYLLWIIIGCVAVITLIAITIVLAVICMRRKSSAQAKDLSRQDVTKPAPPDLWIDHERHELNGRRQLSETDNDTDEMTSMLQSNIDVSASMAGDVPYHDDSHFSSMTRSGRPVIIAPNPHREGMPRAAVPPITGDPSRPLFPRTQFAPAGGQYDSTPRVHVGDTSQPSSDGSSLYDERMGHPVTPTVSLFSRGLSPRDFTIRSTASSPATSRRMKPQPSSAFRMTNQMTGSSYQPESPTQHEVANSSAIASPPSSHRDMHRRPMRQSSQSPNLTMNTLSASREDLKSSMMTQSTEQLSAEMANLDCIMQDLNAIKNDFERT
ncbi:neogenin-like isoform X2 [Watersipora subatra]|uniref:neogenin-like isoform X2 n=1 Tax=Watersipora subatra TaxID=2589382 RepID=UPI00355C0C89